MRRAHRLGGRSKRRPGLRSAAVAALFALAAVCGLSAQESSWSFGGSLAHRAYGAVQDSSGEADYSYGSLTTLETTLSAKGTTLRAEFSTEADLFTGSAAAALSALKAWFPEDTLFAPVSPTGSEDTALAVRVRTAYVKWNPNLFALTVGRQIINYGKGVVWSPVDIFTATDYSGLSLVRQGSDAARITVPLGALSMVEIVAAPDSEPAEGAYALRLAGLLFDAVDGALVGAWDGETDAWTTGADAKIDLSFVSFYADAAVSLPYYGGDANVRAVAGFDTSFGDFILVGEYYHNGGGASSDYYFPGAHNVYASLTWDLADYHTLALSGLSDIENGIFSVQTIWAYDLAQNGSLTAYVKIGNGSFPSGSKTWAGQLGAQFEVKF